MRLMEAANTVADSAFVSLATVRSEERLLVEERAGRGPLYLEHPVLVTRAKALAMCRDARRESEQSFHRLKLSFVPVVLFHSLLVLAK